MENLEKEIWKDIPEWESFYSISNFGRVLSKRRNRLLDVKPNTGGYHIDLRGKNDGKRYRFYTHYLVWWTFVTNKIDENIRLHHKDKNHLNNKLDNLLDITDNEGFRTCKKCHTLKSITEFKMRNDTKQPRRNCKECIKDGSKDYYHKNTEIIIKKSKEWRNNNKERATNNRKRYYNENKERLGKLDRARKKEREKTDINYKLRRRYKGLLYNGLKKQGVSKNKRPSANFVGCSWDKYKEHIESQFEPWMTWENYGDKSWHYGHIEPCELFDLRNENEVKLCFHYTNIRPEHWLKNITNQDFLSDGRRARDLTREERVEYLKSKGIII